MSVISALRGFGVGQILIQYRVEAQGIQLCPRPGVAQRAHAFKRYKKLC